MATVSPSWNYTLHLPHDPRAPGIARGALRLILAAHRLPDLTPTAELLAAELLANAHCHTKGPYAFRLRACADAAGVSVLREPGASQGGKLLWAECGVPG
ncbi:hypothetical protein [Streptomyces pseudovenezuelae]|uniref:hypothetical protein n=1 Tax=Streptomyces pseudovenezuelae TaxID=67350 RepID=UPI0036E47289